MPQLIFRESGKTDVAKSSSEIRKTLSLVFVHYFYKCVTLHQYVNSKKHEIVVRSSLIFSWSRWVFISNSRTNRSTPFLASLLTPVLNIVREAPEEIL